MKSKKKVLSKVNKLFLNNLENMCKRKTGIPIEPEKKKNIKKINVRQKVTPKIIKKNTPEIKSPNNVNKTISVNTSTPDNNILIIKYFFYYIIAINIILISNPILFYILFRYL